MKLSLAKAYAFVTDPKFKTALENGKNALLILLLIGMAFDLITPDKFHTLQDALAGMAF